MSYRLTNKQLAGWFKQANRWYFKNRLPKSTILKFKRLPGKFGVAHTNFIQRKPTKQELKRRPNCVLVMESSFKIFISTELQGMRDMAIMTLLHEMVHCAHWKRKGHGKRFDREMLKLAKLGAFDGLW